MAFVTGGNSTNERQTIIEDFLNGKTNVVISTDILSEGQNLQQAKTVTNYDLHWNPVRMIQRAGRIDRIGTPFKEIIIYNLAKFCRENHLNYDIMRKLRQGKYKAYENFINLSALTDVIHLPGVRTYKINI